MRITIVTGPFYSPPPAPGGAVERRWFHVARHFAALGHDVTFLSRRHDGTLAKEQTLDGVRHRRRTAFRSTRSFPLNLAKDALYTARMLAMLPKADVLVTNTFWLPAVAPRLRRGAGRLSVNVARVPKGQLKLYRKADRLVGVSTAIKDAICREAPELCPRTTYVPNPIDTDVFTPRGQEPARPAVVYTGRVHPEKGLDVLCDAFRDLRRARPDLTLWVIGAWKVEDGGGGGAFRDDLEKRAGEGAEFVDPIYDREALAEAIRGGTVYCYPSRAEKGEAFPCAPLEAMGCGRACVVSDLPQFDDYVRDGENAVRFDHRGDGAPANLARAIAGLLDDRDRRNRLAAAAARTAAGYSFSAVAKLYLDDFEAMLKEPRP